MVRNILGYKCKGCQTVYYPNRAICKKCGASEFEATVLPKNGTLLTFTKLHNLAADFEVSYLTLGIVELEGGNRITGQLKIADPKIGMKVKGKVEMVRGSEYRKSFGMVFYD